MSKKTETISVELPLELAEKIASDKGVFRHCKEGSAWPSDLQESVIEALNALKTKYEQWKDGWGGMSSRVAALVDDDWELGEATTMAAAPQMAMALVELYQDGIAHGVPRDNMFTCIEECIRLALPKEVADEILE